MILVAILTPCLMKAREGARAASCSSNLHQIGLAIAMYETDYDEKPPLTLTPALLPYAGNAEALFHCPSDAGAGDSYTRFYIPRHTPDLNCAIITCPRHPDGYITAVMYYQGSVKKQISQPVFADGEEVRAGELVTDGRVEFADGTVVTIRNTPVEILFSVTHDHGIYSAIRIPSGSTGGVDVDAAPGTKFEVVTPACIAGVRGTKFSVDVGWYGPSEEPPIGLPSQGGGPGGWGWTTVTVHEGKVWVKGTVHGQKSEIDHGHSGSFSFPGRGRGPQP
jgi:hypothetical protein